MSGKYDDIIDLPHPTSQNHPRMSLHDRAAQFSPVTIYLPLGLWQPAIGMGHLVA